MNTRILASFAVVALAATLGGPAVAQISTGNDSAPALSSPPAGNPVLQRPAMQSQPSPSMPAPPPPPVWQMAPNPVGPGATTSPGFGGSAANMPPTTCTPPNCGTPRIME